MREVISIATMFLMLAAAGMEPESYKSAKMCQTGKVAEFLSLTC
jgi:hypothetical protein